MPNPPPTLLFIPGSWHKPSCFHKVTAILQESHNLKCISITLPSTTGNPAATFKDDLDVARAAITTETAQGRDVVVIAHSYGGMIGNSAIKGFTQQQQQFLNMESESVPVSGTVIGLILIASGFTLTGLAFLDLSLGHPPPFFQANTSTGYAELTTPSPREFFYHDLPGEEGEFWVSQLTTQSLKSLNGGGEFAYSGWMDVPVWYIGTIEDHGLPVLAQRMLVGMARGMGGRVEHYELRTSHSPFLSRPEETVGVLVRAVEAFTGADMHKPEEGNISNGVATSDLILGVVPQVRLLQPSTWVRFGLPLVFGRVVGKGILLFGLGRRVWKSRFGLRSL
ncbi:alpha/beta-hydrolase [Aspergillus cavernicola]|uniref:Alpha/beta-hydrolase n=1 Tax=Aspergillus cavernicola TaxID=176166 RepID=A0ABR4IF53_9EURO